jgi:hypothetical protein
MAAIVTSPYADAVLEAEAERQHASFVVRPVADTAFLDAVGRSLGEGRDPSPDQQSSQPSIC